jgi:4-hydroxyphenylacetate 3-monooxygenase
MCRAQFHDTHGQTFQNYQAQIRLSVKIKFLAGVARRLAETIGIAGMPPVREELGWIAAQAGMVDSMLTGMEAAGHVGNGAYVPNKHCMYAAQVLTQELYPRIIKFPGKAWRYLINGSMNLNQPPDGEYDGKYTAAGPAGIIRWLVL